MFNEILANLNSFFTRHPVKVTLDSVANKIHAVRCGSNISVQLEKIIREEKNSDTFDVQAATVLKLL